MFKVHERSIRVHHLGNRIVFHIPLEFEPIVVVKAVHVENGRMVVDTVQRLDENIYSGPMYPGEKLE